MEHTSRAGVSEVSMLFRQRSGIHTTSIQLHVARTVEFLCPSFDIFVREKKFFEVRSILTVELLLALSKISIKLFLT